MANSFDLRLKQVQVGSWAVSGRTAVALLVAVLLGMIGLWQARLLPHTATPGEAISVQSITMPTDDSIVVQIRNSGTEPVSVAQIQVDAAYWSFAIKPSTPIVPSKHASIQIPYVWVPGEPHIITIVTRSGATFEGRIDAPSLTATR